MKLNSQLLAAVQSKSIVLFFLGNIEAAYLVNYAFGQKNCHELVTT